MADKKSKSQTESGADSIPAEPSLGHVITETRERKGLTRDQVANETHLPPHYIKMIESDSYDLIADRLYLVPFLRRYASFLGLDAEEIASRFVSDVQHSEASVVRLSQEITVVTKQPGAAGRIAFAVLIAAVVVLLADFAWRRFVEHETLVPATVASPAAMAPASLPNAAAPNENLPPATVVSNPEAAAPPAASNDLRPANVPPAADRAAPPQPMRHAPGDD